MITGFNTDVRHGSKVYHVQTEDKGLTNPKIETLIYVGGEILDSYRSSYEDMLANPPVVEGAILARMEEQHKAIIRDIKNGKYDATPGGVPDLGEAAIFNDKPLDQAILEYLQQEGEVDTLEMVLDQPLKPVFGALFQFQIKARLTHSQNPVEGADVTVKLVSSLKKAAVLAQGKTDREGLYKGSVELPGSQPGQCAVVVSCLSENGSDEVKAPLKA
jgi:hypothetical protein